VGGLLIIIILVAAFWLVAVVPRRRRLQQHRAMQDALTVGDEVITAGGLHGRVRELQDGEIRLEIAQGVVVTADRRAIAAVATEVEVEAHEEAELSAAPPPEASDQPR
jgi:preprotein translocase subunit YajC